MFNYSKETEWFIPVAHDVYLKYATDDEGKWKPQKEARGADLSDEEKSRPEYILGQEVEISADVENMYTVYKTLLEGCARVRAFLGKSSDEKAQKKLDSILEWLDKTDMKTGPASTVYHESYEGGLVVHSLKVFNQMLTVHRMPCFAQFVPFHSAVLVALVHDWCKINRYESYIRNVKNEETGEWERVKAYKRKEAPIPLGHGVASLFQASQCFALDVPEALAIRWHMGKWNVADNEVDELQTANENCPAVHMIQFADVLAITKYADAKPEAK